MSLLQVVVQSLVQGITEFLPISSWAHVIVVRILTGWPDQGLLIEVAVHVGTLGAVMLYFWRDLRAMLTAMGSLFSRRQPFASRLTVQLVVATLPVVVAGAMLFELGTEALRTPAVIGWSMLGFGVLLYAADYLGMTVRRVEHMTVVSAMWIGLAQVLALIPGTSRAGITITAARFLGFERQAAARFSMLLSIPVIAAAGVRSVLELYRLGDVTLTVEAGFSAALAFVAALAAIALLMRWLRRARFTPFVVYRVIVGAALLVWVYT